MKSATAPPDDSGNRFEVPSLSFRPAETMLSVPEQIADRICTAILQGEYVPGARIPENSVAEAFNVSRGPVREALRLLEHEGLVTFSPRRGARVTALSVNEVRQLFDIRAALSRLAAEEASRNATEALLRSFADCVAKQQKVSRQPKGLEKYCALSAQAGLIVAAASGNPRLQSMIQSLSRQTLRYAQLGLSTRARRQESAGLWKELLDAIRAGNAVRAGTINATLVERSRDAAILRLRDDE
jgi:DNA-binding GntR family transcriptional regulator